MNSPTGTSVLVGVLDERREQLRNEGLLLLLRLVKDHQEIQKRVAFENAFEKVFGILHEEGGLEGGIVTTDCFKLLRNLLAGNISNQNWFRETEFFKSITELLKGIDKDTTFSGSLIENIIALMGIVRLFVQHESKDKTTNQNCFLKAGLVTHLVGLAFAVPVPQIVRAEALIALADLIHNNHELQQYFLKASSVARDPLNVGSDTSSDFFALFAILLEDGEDDFEIKYAASLCVQSFAFGSHERRRKIVQTIIDAYLASEPGNLLEGVLNFSPQSDQFRVWFSCNTLLHLTHEDEVTRYIFTDLLIGDATAGEEEVSLIQTISANAVSALQNGKARSAAAYIMLLSSWLFESRDNVADFLEESSTLQALIGSLQAYHNNEVMRGLCAALLSVCYAFDFSDKTPVNRATLQTILLRVGREVIMDALVAFSHCEALRLPDALKLAFDRPILDPIFVDFFRDNYGLIRKAIDQAPAPPRTRREAEAQEEQERAEDIIADLEMELERKSSGLEEAIGIIKTRQEELQRLRDEIKYTTQKHKVELSNIQAELERQRQEASQLKTEATKASNEVDKSLRDNSILHSEVEKRQADLNTLEEQHRAASERVADLQSQVDSEGSKRNFLENELRGLRDTSGAASEQLEKFRVDLEDAVDKLGLVTNEADIAKAQLVQISGDLTEARAAQKKAEAEVVRFRTRARDLDTDLKGVQKELMVVSQAHEKERLALNVAAAELREKLAAKTKEVETLTETLGNVEARHAARLKQLDRDRSSDIETLQNRNNDLIEQLKEKTGSAASSDQGLTNGSSKMSSNASDEEYQRRIEALEHEKAELQKQLEQAQEDLVLFMEDAGEVE